MDPLVVYVLILLGGIVVCLLGVSAATEPMRVCPQCGDEVPTRSRKCRGCAYRFGP